MYILGELFLYAIDMLYNALTFKLSVLYFFNWLVIIAQQNSVSKIINSTSSLLCVHELISEWKSHNTEFITPVYPNICWKQYNELTRRML